MRKKCKLHAPNWRKLMRQRNATQIERKLFFSWENLIAEHSPSFITSFFFVCRFHYIFSKVTQKWRSVAIVHLLYGLECQHNCIMWWVRPRLIFRERNLFHQEMFRLTSLCLWLLFHLFNLHDNFPSPECLIFIFFLLIKITNITIYVFSSFNFWSNHHNVVRRRSVSSESGSFDWYESSQQLR